MLRRNFMKIDIKKALLKNIQGQKGEYYKYLQNLTE